MPEPEAIYAMIEAARNGDDVAESSIHRAFVNRLVALATRYIGQRYRSKVDPEDVVQSVFGSFFTRHRNGQFEFEGFDDIWLILARITVRKSITKINSYGTFKRDIHRERIADGKESLSSFFGPGNDPSPQETAIFEDLMDQFFERIPEKLQQIVILKLQGFTNFEISQSLSYSIRTVCRSLSKIRVAFEELDSEIEP